MNIPNIDYQARLAQARQMMAGAGNAAGQFAGSAAMVPLTVGGAMAAYDAMTGDDNTSALGYVGGALGGAAGTSLGSTFGGSVGGIGGGALGALAGAGVSLVTRGRVPMEVGAMAGGLLGGVVGGGLGASNGAYTGATQVYSLGQGVGDRANRLLNEHLGL